MQIYFAFLSREGERERVAVAKKERKIELYRHTQREIMIYAFARFIVCVWGGVIC
jgi:hypothetical protein